MKRCSSCGRTFDDDTDFCLEDGTRLTADIGGYQSSAEMPTQVIERPHNIPYPGAPVVVSQSSRWIYPVVGILCGLVVIFGYLAFFRQSPDNTAQIKSTAAESNKNTESTPKPTSTPFVPPSPPPTVSQAVPGIVTVNSPRDRYLALKSEPCVAPCGALLVKIPHGTRITLESCKAAVEIADRRPGHWCYTSYGGVSGWIFDGFVTR
ncbi:MAG TPA: hypothetical protein VGP12_01945 [Nitrosospira sp.]|jgi:hypothetical protein|nr:hypothetical protein [Nitrosospira sp.]